MYHASLHSHNALDHLEDYTCLHKKLLSNDNIKQISDYINDSSPRRVSA